MHVTVVLADVALAKSHAPTVPGAGVADHANVTVPPSGSLPVPEIPMALPSLPEYGPPAPASGATLLIATDFSCLDYSRTNASQAMTTCVPSIG